MATYVRCIVPKGKKWKALSKDPEVAKAADRIIAAGEPTPQKGVTYRSIGTYSKWFTKDGEEYEGYFLEEFDWSEYLIGKDKLPAQVFWDVKQFKVVESKFEPNKYLTGPDGDHHVETMQMFIELPKEYFKTLKI